MTPGTSALIVRLHQAQRYSTELCAVGHELVQQAQALRSAPERSARVPVVRPEVPGEGRPGDAHQHSG